MEISHNLKLIVKQKVWSSVIIMCVFEEIKYLCSIPKKYLSSHGLKCYFGA